MKNYEKYLDLVLESVAIAVGKNGKPCRCDDMFCEGCAFAFGRHSCKKKALEWLKSEYVEPEVDWSKVEVDTKILVRNIETENWQPRHFAKYENGNLYAYADGKSSFTAYNYVFSWNFAKLYEGDQEHGKSNN